MPHSASFSAQFAPHRHLIFSTPKFFQIRFLFLPTFLFLSMMAQIGQSLILSGGTDSFARYPKWAQTFENELSLEFKTRSSNALLLYADDGAFQHNFFSISLLDGRVQFEFRLGEQQMDPAERRALIQIGMPETRIDDGRWHRLTFFQAWENVKIQLDEEIVFRVLDQRSFSLGNIRTNSDMFIGGIPKELEKMSSPLRRHSHRFAGSIRNLFYRIYPQGMANPLLMDSLGTRKTDEDYCQTGGGKSPNDGEQSYCQNDGRCFSANNGPRCDCSFSDFEGRRCEIKKPSTEVSFFGNEWLGYDLSGIPASDSTMEEPNRTKIATQNDGVDDLLAVWSRRELYNITFRTNLSSSIIFIAGDSRNHVKLLLEKGVILAQSQLADTEMRQIRVQDRARRRVHLDDGLWHSVCLIRELNSPGLKNAVFSIRLIVDDFFDQDVRQFAHHPWLGNSFFFIGGAPNPLAHLIPEHLFPFRGCIKKAFFQSGPIQLNMVQLADQGFGQSNVQTFGDLSYSCSPNAQIPEVFSFNSGLNYTKLPAWRSPARGTLAFQFRTLLSEGLILYHGMANCKNFTICDYLAFELVDGHLMMVINLGSGNIHLQASAKTLNDGHWHSVVMERSGRRGFITADSLRTDFACPGISANLNIEEPIYLGGVPWPNPFIPRDQQGEIESVTVIELVQKEVEQEKANINFPSAIWTIGLRQGFIGCLKNIRVNGINAEIAAAFLNQTASEKSRNIHGKGATISPISAGCPFSFAANFCAKSTNGGKYPCKNDGQCHSLHNSFKCDCSNSLFDGPICQQKPRLVQFPLPFPFMARFVLSAQWQIESENIDFKFRPRIGGQGQQTQQEGLFVLMDTKVAGGPQRLLVAMMADGGLLADWVFASGEERIFQWANGSIGIVLEEQWHSAKIRRRGRNLGLFFDGEWTNYTLQAQNPSIGIEELAIGQPIGLHRIRDKPEHLFRFHGDFRQFSVNGHDLLKSMRMRSGGNKRQQQQSNFRPIEEQLRFHWKTTKAPKMLASSAKMETEKQFLAINEPFATANPLSFFSPSLPPLSAQQFAYNDSFFTKAPLGCFNNRQSAISPHSCEPEPTPEDSFFTPIVSKPFQRPLALTSTTNLPSTTQTSPSTQPTSKSTFSTTTKSSSSAKPSSTTQKGSNIPKSAANSSSSSKSSDSSSRRSSSSSAAVDSSINRSTQMPGSREQLELLAAQRQRFQQNSATGDKSQGAGGYYEPVGGWPMRTRTWPDGRRLGQDGVRKWQKLRPTKIVGESGQQRNWPKEREEKKTTMTKSSSSTQKVTKTTAKSTETTTTTMAPKTMKMTTVKTTTMPKPTELVTVDPNMKPGVHFTFAPTASTTAVQRKLSPSTPTTLAHRFPVGPDDPTLYAVRPTTPMNGAASAFGTQNTAPTSIGPPTSTNQLGFDKKILIGVGSLSIVVMLAAILLCVFGCGKRCNHICLQIAAAAGISSTPNQVPPGFKAGYTPIPPNEFASPQMQHQMANFENNGTTARNAVAAGGTATVTTSLLRNGGGGGGQIGNGIGATERGQPTRVILANGNGGLRETTSLVNAGIGGQQQQRKREFKEWYV